MEHNLQKHPLRMMHTVCDEFEERAVDLDIILPDYCPEIAEILKCTITPFTSRCFQSGERYVVEGTTQIRVFYLSNDRSELHCYDATEPFSVSFRVANAVQYKVNVKADYVNCRAISARRMDIHGAFRVYLKATGVTELTVAAFENSRNICCKTVDVVSTIPAMQIDKSFSVSEDIPLGMEFDRLVYSDVTVVEHEHKALSNKVIVKGKIRIRLVLSKDGAVKEAIETIPFSQIVDSDGFYEDWHCISEVDIGEKDIRAIPNESGMNAVSACIKLFTHMFASYDERSTVILDAYSVVYPLLCETTQVSIPCKVEFTNTEHTVVPLTVSLPENIRELIDVWGDVRCEATTDSHIHCCYTVSAFVRDSEGHISYIENVIDDTVNKEEYDTAVVRLLGMNGVISGNRLHIQAEIEKYCVKEQMHTVSVVTDMIEDTQNPFCKSNATIRVVYADEGDSVWDIAKQHHAVADMIIAENDLDSDHITTPTVLMIPV